MRHSAGVSAHNLGQNQFLSRDTLGFSFANKYCNEAGDQYVGMNEVQLSKQDKQEISLKRYTTKERR